MSNPLDQTLRELDACGCGSGTTPETPADIHNRPGLDSIAYRVGTHSQFKSSMLSALSSTRFPALAELRTRDDDDFTIALLDGWATVSDVLSFYSERIANEGFLRTATETRSIRELARAIGYELNPGVAASTLLSFAIESAAGSPPLADIAAGVKAQSVPGPNEKPQVFETIEAIEARPQWNLLRPRTRSTQHLDSTTETLYLEGTRTGLRKGDVLVIVGNEILDSNRWDLRRVKQLDLEDNVDPLQARTVVRLDRHLGAEHGNVGPSADSPFVYALRQRASLFGANAPSLDLMSSDTQTAVGVTMGDLDGDGVDDGRFEWKNFTLAGISGENVESMSIVHLDAVYPEIVVGSFIAISAPSYAAELFRVKKVEETAPSMFGLTAKVTKLTVEGQNLLEYNDQLRQATVFIASELLPWSREPIVDPVKGDVIDLESVLDPVVPNGRRLIVQSVKADVVQTEALTVRDSSSATGHTRLLLAEPMKLEHPRDTAVIFANVAPATHGESIGEEVLGSGDGNQTYQRFVLKQGPLTYVRSIDGGSKSTLRVWVDGVQWAEAPTFYGRGKNERIYVVRMRDDGKATIIFGDGKNGARLPTGRENIRATYRKGLGHAGNFGAGRLTLLVTRPLGVKAVDNPVATEGGLDPQALDAARANAPFTVLTMDRAVSLRDYEDYARNFGGIDKALATWTWHPTTRGVLVTVAESTATGGAVSTTRDALRAALLRWGNPLLAIDVQPYAPVAFKLSGTVVVSADRQLARVKDDVRATLSDHFSFTRRQFGQPVTLSEVEAVIQQVAGVAYVDLDALHTGASSRLDHYLPASVPANGAAADLAKPAELLTLDVGSLDALTFRLEEAAA